MKTIKFVSYFIVTLFLGMTLNSCEGEAGPAGQDGANGIDGTNGQDGNANVQTYTFDVSANSGNSFIISLAAITDDVLANDAVLHYLSTGTFWYPVPGTGFSGNHIVRSYDNVGHVFFHFEDYSGSAVSIAAGTYQTAKIIIIESSNTTTGRSGLTPKEQVYAELENEGVDVNDYYAVCAYYGINP